MTIDDYRSPIYTRRQIVDVLDNIFSNKHSNSYKLKVLTYLEEQELLNIYFEEYLPKYVNGKNIMSFHLINDLKFHLIGN